MKKHLKNTLVVSSLLFSFSAPALDVPHLDGYDTANPSMWDKVKADTVPSGLVTKSYIDDPRNSYAQMFPRSFFQEDLYAVCYQDCKNKDVVKVSGSNVDAGDNDSFEQANVYFWLKHYFNFLEERFSFRPARFLKVMTNRTVKDPTAGSKMRNNAFYNPADDTLSFLPASNNFLFNALQGKINRSGYDPSVISHEASHFFFQHLYPNAINYEISGLNEGFADYIANIHINNPKVGLIMLRGKPLRDSSSLTLDSIDSTTNERKLKKYSPGLEAHDLGELVATSLWLSREVVDNKEEYDRLVIDAVKDIAQGPYSTVHSFKRAMLARVPGDAVKNIWNTLLAGEEKVITDKSFLSLNTIPVPYLGFRINQTISARFAQEMGLNERNTLGFMFHKNVNLANDLFAVLASSENESVGAPFWFVMDNKTNSVLGIYGLDGHLVTDKDELKKIEPLTTQVLSHKSTIAEFIVKDSVKYADLAQGKGDFTKAYKITNIQSIPDTMLFNNVPTAITRIEVSLKKKLLLSLLVGLPDVNQVTVYTAPMNISSLPLVNGQRVIGYKLQLANGTAIEMVLNKYGKAQ